MSLSKVENVCDMLAQLAWGSKTAADISEATGVSMTTTYRWLKEMRKVGLVGKTGALHASGNWYLNLRPFQNELVDGSAEYASWEMPEPKTPGVVRHIMERRSNPILKVA